MQYASGWFGMKTTKIFYDMMPDYSVSVYLNGDWDFFKSYTGLVSFCESEFGDDFELVDITNTTIQDRFNLGICHE